MPITDSAYTGQIIRHEGIDYAVLDTTKLHFDGPDAALGKKTKPTVVKIAKPGELVVTVINGVEESRVTAKGGEPIFINMLPGGKQDTFIPPDGAKVLAEKYELVSPDKGQGATYQPKGAPAKILPEAVKKPTVIMDAWGPGQHQFLVEGATLKQDGAKATGIAKAAFDETWSITDKQGRPAMQAARTVGEAEWHEQRIAERHTAAAPKAKTPSNLAFSHLKGAGLGFAGAAMAATMKVHEGVGAMFNAASEAVLPGSTTVGKDVCKVTGTVLGGVAGLGAAGVTAATTFAATAVPLTPFGGGAVSVVAGGAAFSATQPGVSKIVQVGCDALVPDAVKKMGNQVLDAADKALAALETAVKFGGSEKVAQTAHKEVVAGASKGMKK